MKKTIWMFLFLAYSMISWAQETTVFTDANRAYKDGLELFEKGVYGAAQESFQETLDLLLPANTPRIDLLKTQARLYMARCAIRQELPDGEKLMLDFIREVSPDPASGLALIELAGYYFNTRDYDKAIQYYSQVPEFSVQREELAEVKFKMGYAYFVQKKFGRAKSNFQSIKGVQNEYYYPTNYYLGLINFFEGKYDDAIKNFRIVERSRSKRYKAVLPYYLTQIYFAEGRYDDLLDYAIPKLNQGGIKNLKEVYQLVGQTYFERKQYSNALPYLEYYAERSGKMREEEFYQLGVVYMESGQARKAIKHFEELASTDSQLGQTALYNLGRLHLEVKGRNSKNSARNAFASASRMDYDPIVRDEALFNYAKLSYELKYDRESIEALQSITPESKYYGEAQSLMSKIFLDTRDYERALATLNSLPNLTPELEEALQHVTYYRGLQLYQENKFDEAKSYFDQSLQHPLNPRIKALTVYWQGDYAHKKKKYDESSRYMNQFLTLSRPIKDLPDASSIHTANYIQGYNYLKQENYTGALGYFQETIAGIKRNAPFIQDKMVKSQVLGDAVVRAGDCLFKRNRYRKAVQFYDEAISKRYRGFVYGLYQKAVIEGLQGRTTEKILALERIINNYSNSPFADDALLQLGITYQGIGELSRAIRPLEILVRDYRGKSDLLNQALIQLGLVTYNQNNLEQAINYYKQVFSNNPEPNEAQTALKALEEIYVSDLSNPDAYFAFLKTIPGYEVDNMERDAISFRSAETQFENGNYERAIEQYTNYIAKFPNGSQIILAHYRRGDAYSAMKLYSNALLDYEYVVKKGQSRYFGKALDKAALIAYNHEQDFERAYKLYVELESVAESNDMRLEAQLGQLRSAYRANLTDEMYQLVEKVSGNNLASDAQIAQANFYLGKIAYDRRDYGNALTALNRVTTLSDDEQTAEARYLIAYIYYLERDLDKAQEVTLNANRESSRYPYWVAKCVILLSDILAEKGDLFNARAALEALLENYSGDEGLVQTAQEKLAVLNRRLSAESRIDSSTEEFILDDSQE